MTLPDVQRTIKGLLVECNCKGVCVANVTRKPRLKYRGKGLSKHQPSQASLIRSELGLIRTLVGQSETIGM